MPLGPMVVPRDHRPRDQDTGAQARGSAAPPDCELLESRGLLRSPSPWWLERPWARPRAHRLCEGKQRASPSVAPAACPWEPRPTAALCPGAPAALSAMMPQAVWNSALTWQERDANTAPGKSTFQKVWVVQRPSTCCSLPRREVLQALGIPRGGAPLGWAPGKNGAVAKPSRGAAACRVRGSHQEFKRQFSFSAGEKVRFHWAPVSSSLVPKNPASSCIQRGGFLPCPAHHLHVADFQYKHVLHE